MSLRTRDRDVARRHARRLGVAMDEIVEEAKLRPVTQSYLASYLREHLETYADQMARNAAASRRWIVTPERVRSEVDADLASGWAYNLLSSFGRQTAFAFDDACPGRDWLARQGVDAASIERIATSHRLPIEDARRPCYEDAYRDRLMHDGRNPVPADVERLVETDHEARAQALLDVASRHALDVAATNSADAKSDVAAVDASQDDGERTLAALRPSMLRFVDRQRTWDVKTKAQAKQTLDLFLQVLEEGGVSSARRIDQRYLGAFPFC